MSSTAIPQPPEGYSAAPQPPPGYQVVDHSNWTQPKPLFQSPLVPSPEELAAAKAAIDARGSVPAPPSGYKIAGQPQTEQQPDFFSEAYKKVKQLGHFLSVGGQLISGDPVGAVTQASLDTGGKGIKPSELIAAPLRELTGEGQPGESVTLGFTNQAAEQQPLLTRTGMMLDTLMGGDPASARENFAKGNTGAGVADLLTTPGVLAGPLRATEVPTALETVGDTLSDTLPASMRLENLKSGAQETAASAGRGTATVLRKTAPYASKVAAATGFVDALYHGRFDVAAGILAFGRKGVQHLMNGLADALDVGEGQEAPKIQPGPEADALAQRFGAQPEPQPQPPTTSYPRFDTAYSRTAVGREPELLPPPRRGQLLLAGDTAQPEAEQAPAKAPTPQGALRPETLPSERTLNGESALRMILTGQDNANLLKIARSRGINVAAEAQLKPGVADSRLITKIIGDFSPDELQEVSDRYSDNQRFAHAFGDIGPEAWKTLNMKTYFPDVKIAKAVETRTAKAVGQTAPPQPKAPDTTAPQAATASPVPAPDIAEQLQFMNQARQELGPRATLPQVTARAQELRTLDLLRKNSGLRYDPETGRMVRTQ